MQAKIGQSIQRSKRKPPSEEGGYIHRNQKFGGRTNAEQFGKTYDDELHRVIIHGILHLCGINDKGPGEREIMEENENKALALLEGASILKK